MTQADQCIGLIINIEDGLVDNPKDPGGLTKYGISKRAYPHLDIRNLTVKDAQTIYRNDYWNLIKGDQLPKGLDLLVFDCAVNQGVVTAIEFLQEAAKVTVDGVIGEKTIAAARNKMPGVMQEFCVIRAWRYEINRNEDEFGKGWYRRLFGLYNLAKDWQVIDHE
ncbi:MAG: glycosyl hydrolase 108 family protein [Candidatus Contendobacter sp.]|nr:glycosyl hydrolase 108 family protein [Candidatus Contendobacter sp.]